MYLEDGAMIIIGIILMVCGAGALLWANNMQNSFEYKWYEMFGSSDYEYVDVIFYIGIFILIIGFILLIVGCSRRISQYDKSNHTVNSDIHSTADTNPFANDFICKKCGVKINENVSFCPNCGSKNDSDIAKKKFCGNCGSQVKDDDLFCANCGYKF